MKQYDPTQSQDQQKEANWGHLDPRLIAQIGLVEEFMHGGGLDGQQVRDYWPAENGPTVKAVMTDGDLSQANSWSSPFEAQNLEQQFPTLAGGLQTGSLADAIGNVSQGSLDGATRLSICAEHGPAHEYLDIRRVLLAIDDRAVVLGEVEPGWHLRARA